MRSARPRSRGGRLVGSELRVPCFVREVGSSGRSHWTPRCDDTARRDRPAPSPAHGAGASGRSTCSRISTRASSSLSGQSINAAILLT
jgi:hypothetical protein